MNADFNLANMCDAGHGVPKHPAQARELLQRAAHGGHTLAARHSLHCDTQIAHGQRPKTCDVSFQGNRGEGDATLFQVSTVRKLIAGEKCQPMARMDYVNIAKPCSLRREHANVAHLRGRRVWKKSNETFIGLASMHWLLFTIGVSRAELR